MRQMLNAELLWPETGSPGGAAHVLLPASHFQSNTQVEKGRDGLGSPVKPVAEPRLESVWRGFPGGARRRELDGLSPERGWPRPAGAFWAEPEPGRRTEPEHFRSQVDQAVPSQAPRPSAAPCTVRSMTLQGQPMRV